MHVDPEPASVPHRNVDVANAMRVLRPTLGDDAGVALYRLLQTIFQQKVRAREIACIGGLGDRG